MSAARASAPRVSVVLPTLNGEADLRRLLPALAAQELPEDWNGLELCAVDSSSDDGTRALLEAAGARVRTIARADFGHGRTRNLGAGDARGELLVFLSQDAVPARADFLRRLVEPFEDPRTAGVTARVLPHADDDPLTRRTVLDRPEASAEPRCWPRAPGEDPGRDADGEPRFNDVASAIRAAVLRALPFPDVPFGEDVAWAARALAAGHRIRFAPEAVVLHAHRYGPRAAFRRYRTDASFHREQLGRRVRPGPASALKGFLHEWRADLSYLLGPEGRGHAGTEWLAAFALSPWLRAAQVAGQLAGSRGPLGAPAGRSPASAGPGEGAGWARRPRSRC